MADQKIRIGIVGYGNLGKGVELAIRQNDDMELVGVFTRRDPDQLQLATPNMKKYRVEDAEKMQDQIDVMILCGGSATDLAVQGPQFAAHFNTVDSFDTHAKIPEYFDSMNQTAKVSGKVAAISVGWDPGMFSINRMYGDAILPQGKTYTFWGKGVSQGHSDAIRRVKGVKNGIQYTIPIEEAVNRVRHGEDPELSTREKHLRECFVVAEEGADKVAIEQEIKNMPNYFSDYDTVVHFITEEQLKADIKMPQQFRLKNHFKKIENEYDYYVIDCSPSISILNVNALAAADEVYLPVRCDGWSAVGVVVSKRLIDTVSEYNPALKIGGYFFTHFNARKKISKEILTLLNVILPEYFIPVTIPQSKDIEEMSVTGIPIGELDKNRKRKITQNYWELTKYIASNDNERKKIKNILMPEFEQMIIE